MMMSLFIMTVLTATAAQLDCQDCTTVTNTLKDIVTTKEDIDIQIEVLLAELCPNAAVPEDCMAGLPAFWAALAPIMWEAALDSTAWCDDCSQKRASCEECQQFVHRMLEELQM